MKYNIRVYLGYNIKGYLSTNGKIVDLLLAKLYTDKESAEKAAEKQNAKNNGYTYKIIEIAL